MIQIQDLSKIYGKKEVKCVALKHVSLHINKGDFVAIMGSSGSGKTTLFRIISGLDHEYFGSCKVMGQEVSDLSDKERCMLRKNHMGIIYQFFNLVSFLTVEENLCLAAQLKGISVQEDDLNLILKYFGLESKRHCFIYELSGGQQQRVAIGRAVLAQADILLADEPTGNLDKKNTNRIMKVLMDVHQKGMTILLVTHDLHVANYADRIVYLEDGSMV